MKTAPIADVQLAATPQTDFITRGLASLLNAKESGLYVDADTVLRKLERKLTVAKTRQGTAPKPRLS